jgi:Fur family ferric uptake transcriptional regulator
MTNQRKAILGVLRHDRSHPTADEIYEKVRKILPRVSMGTVYRNLDVLASLGLIKKLETGFPPMRYDGNTEDHYHLTCTQCGGIEDAPIRPSEDPYDSLKNLENAIGNLTKYGIFGHKLEFIGLCKKCMENEELSGKDAGSILKTYPIKGR